MDSASKRIAIIQSNYIPWKGYFDFIDAVDEFVILDSVQYTRRDWRNRNQIKTARGLQWLTMPVRIKGRFLQRIDETCAVDGKWKRDHLATIRHAYANSGSFSETFPLIEDLYASAPETTVSEINSHFIKGICNYLGIDTVIRSCGDYAYTGEKTERLVTLCRAAGATTYVSGPAARDYLDPQRFQAAGIQLRWKSYAGYPEYGQLHGAFNHHVSIVDLLLNEGQNAPTLFRSTPRIVDVPDGT